MKIFLSCLVVFICFSCKGQQRFGEDKLKLTGEIPLPGVKGRIDHLDINPRQQQLYVAALGNNSVEVVDLGKGVVLHSIKGLQEPQGVCYIPSQNEIAVACGGTGDCLFFSAGGYQQTALLHLGSDADNIRLSENKLYVGYGDGAIAVIDIKTHKLVGDIKLSAHPESFRIDEKRRRMYVNLPGSRSIAVIDLNSYKEIANWKPGGFRSNFPMALDEANNVVLAGFRQPAALVGFDAASGAKLFNTPLVEDADDLFYDPAKKQVFASGGQGSVNIYRQEAANKMTLIANIATSPGARTSLLVPALQQFIVASRAEHGKEASIRVYSIQ